ncbi:hypothetical protein [Xanthomonas sp. NCPPB 2632]|uniref:hypothetical protein n=1 Tax=Xanthomonas sp. NCPPB 2632 TaxID=3240912 RepID=UPI003518BC46
MRDIFLRDVARLVTLSPNWFAHIVRSYTRPVCARRRQTGSRMPSPDRFAHSVRSYKYIGDFDHA